MSQRQPLRERLWKLQGGACILCGREIVYPTGRRPNRPNAPTIDHVKPLARGGKDGANLLLVHRRCNEARGDATATGCQLIWLAFVNASRGIAA